MPTELIYYFIEQNWIIIAGFVAALIMTVTSFKKGFVDTILPEMAVQVINDGATIVDIREVSEFEGGHIQNAINLPLSHIKKDPEKVAQSLTKGKQILMYCHYGSRTTGACKSLVKFIPKTKLVALKGGIEEWKQANFPIIRKTKKAK